MASRAAFSFEAGVGCQAFRNLIAWSELSHLRNCRIVIHQRNRSLRKFGLVQFIDEHIGARIRLRRVHLGISIEDLAYETGCSAIQIQRYEQGLDRVLPSKLFDLAKVLRVSVTHFFEGLVAPPAQGCPSEGAYAYNNEATDLIASYFLACPKKREAVFAHAVALGRTHTGRLN